MSSIAQNGIVKKRLEVVNSNKSVMNLSDAVLILDKVIFAFDTSHRPSVKPSAVMFNVFNKRNHSRFS